MSKQIDNIISTAKRYIGIKESPANSNNVIFNTRYYGKAVYGSDYAWCMAFIWCLFQDIGAPELFYGGDKTASCTALLNYAKKVKQFYPSCFLPGDVVLYSWTGNNNVAVHVGIISEVYADSIKAIEGNTSLGNDSDGGEVMERIRKNSQIIGVYRPNYEEDDIVTQPEFDKMLTVSFESRSKAPVSAWAKSAWDKACKAGIFDGTAPQGLITREQVAIVLDKAGLIK